MSRKRTKAPPIVRGTTTGTAEERAIVLALSEGARYVPSHRGAILCGTVVHELPRFVIEQAHRDALLVDPVPVTIEESAGG